MKKRTFLVSFLLSFSLFLAAQTNSETPTALIANKIANTIENKGAEAAYQQFIKLVNDQSSATDFGEEDVSAIGYAFLRVGKTSEAIRIFKYNVKMNPNSANAYNSLGEALAAAGGKKAAIEHYKKSLELNPKNDNTKKKIADLENQ